MMGDVFEKLCHLAVFYKDDEELGRHYMYAASTKYLNVSVTGLYDEQLLELAAPFLRQLEKVNEMDEMESDTVPIGLEFEKALANEVRRRHELGLWEQPWSVDNIIGAIPPKRLIITVIGFADGNVQNGRVVSAP